MLTPLPPHSQRTTWKMIDFTRVINMDSADTVFSIFFFFSLSIFHYISSFLSPSEYGELTPVRPPISSLPPYVWDSLHPGRLPLYTGLWWASNLLRDVIAYGFPYIRTEITEAYSALAYPSLYPSLKKKKKNWIQTSFNLGPEKKKMFRDADHWIGGSVFKLVR